MHSGLKDANLAFYLGVKPIVGVKFRKLLVDS